jgi:Ni,Fe-hydrogenase I large subunit
MPGGYLNGGCVEPFDHRQVREDTRYSWFADRGPTHPWDSITKPEHGPDRGQYSHAKATRYANQVVQLGPMVDLFLAGDPLITSSHASRFSIPTPPARSTTTACTSMWRPFMPKRAAQTGPGRENRQ